MENRTYGEIYAENCQLRDKLHDMDLRISDLVAALNAEQAKVARLVEANRSIRQNSYTADAVKAMVEGIQ